MQNRIAVEPLEREGQPWREPSPSVRRTTPGIAEQPFACPVDRKSRAFATTLAEWQALATGAPPMLTPAFFLLTARLLDEGDVVLFGARDGATLTAALPLVYRGRTLAALRTDHSARFDLVGHSASVAALWTSIRQSGRWDVLELRGVPADSPLATALPAEAQRDGFPVRVRESSRAPWFPVEGIEQRIHRRFRGDMRRLERQMGGVELERVTTPLRSARRDVLRLEAAAWKGAAGTAIACDERLTGFYAGLARVFAARGRLTLAFLRARGKRIASQFALEDDTTFYLLKTGYDPEYAHFGPGQLLVRETAADAARRGLARYDMLGHATPWKMKWTDSSRPHVEITIYARSPGGRARYFVDEVARPLASRALRAVRGRKDSVAT
jgi:CelD/BcsL family acetyltransferase involved in cellulose biosynthesis